MTGAGKDTLVKGKRSCTVLFFSAYFIYYAVYCVFSSFIVLFLTEQGYSATVCGIITSLTFLANLLMEPVGGYITDTFLPTRRYLLVCIGIVSMVCAFCTKFMDQSWLLLPGLVLADDKIQKQLNLEPGSYVVYISRLRTADGEPVAIEKNYFPVKYSFLLEKQFNDNSLFECLQEEAKVRVASSEKRIELCRATAEEAKLMKVKKGTPLLYIKSVTYTYDREPLYAGVQLFNGETCSFYVCESIEQ